MGLNPRDRLHDFRNQLGDSSLPHVDSYGDGFVGLG